VPVYVTIFTLNHLGDEAEFSTLSLKNTIDFAKYVQVDAGKIHNILD
jgi:hypothetical protein